MSSKTEVDAAFDRYLTLCRPAVREWIAAQQAHVDSARCRGGHPDHQRARGGLKIHIVQTCNKALELNQQFSAASVVETLLCHDLRDALSAPLDDGQLLAIRATKGLPYLEWRHTPHFRFVNLILIADMWSAHVNVEGRAR